MEFPKGARAARLPRLARTKRKAARHGGLSLAVGAAATFLAILVPQLIEALTTGELVLPRAIEPWRVLLLLLLNALGQMLVAYKPSAISTQPSGGEAGLTADG